MTENSIHGVIHDLEADLTQAKSQTLQLLYGLERICLDPYTTDVLKLELIAQDVRRALEDAE